MILRTECIVIHTDHKRIPNIQEIMALLPPEYTCKVSPIADGVSVIVQWDTTVADSFFIGQWIGFLIMDVLALDQFGVCIQLGREKLYARIPMQQCKEQNK